jgi:beta-barrel assembly-enhancing protease
MSSRILAFSGSLVLTATLVVAQTPVTPPDNRYTPEQDVELGQEAAREARQQLPTLRDELTTSFVDDVGRRLIDGISSELQQPQFRYSFDVVNVRDINAFALPGGPMFVNRGMLEAAKNEGEVAGVMAHELSHVVLRHGTAQASAATKYQIGEIVGAVVGAIIGGRTGSVIAQGTSFGLGTAFLKYGREYERQADLLGAQIMARVGYDPRDMANMFKTIESKGGSGGPEWLSSHPNPGNRYDAITKEAASLRVTNPIRESARFTDVQQRLRSLAKAPTTEEVLRKNPRTTRDERSTPRGTSGRGTGRVEPPSNRYREYDEGGLFRISVPDNWDEVPGSTTVTFAPDGAYGQGIFTHGVEVGTTRHETHDVEEAMRELIDSLRQNNPNLRQSSNPTRATISGRRGLQTTLSNISDATNEREQIQLVTVPMNDRNLFYVIAVAPTDEAASYRPTFQRVLDSIRIAQ